MIGTPFVEFGYFIGINSDLCNQSNTFFRTYALNGNIKNKEEEKAIFSIFF